MSDSKLLSYWEGPPEAGDPVACLATSFTFEPDFFETQCLPRFLNLDSRLIGLGDPDLDLLFEQEEMLRETTTAVVVDRTFEASGRSLSWDILPVKADRGVMHAKGTILLWRGLLRVVIGSANLTVSAYRTQVEAAVAFDAHPGTRVPRSVFQQALRAIERIVELAPGDPTENGPRKRAGQVIERARDYLSALQLPSASGRSDPRVEVSLARRGSPALARLERVWRGGPPRRAAVLSPFYDVDGGGAATKALSGALARTGHREVSFVLPVHARAAGMLIRAPGELASGLAKGIEPSFFAFDDGVDGDRGDEPRGLHAKAVLLESDRWVAGLVGSSNFTSAGLAVGGAGNLELNVAIGAKPGSEAGKAILALIRKGRELDPADGEWEPQPDPEDESLPVLPLGFWEVLLQPGDPASLLLSIRDDKDFPSKWSVCLPDQDQPLLESKEWEGRGRPPVVELSIDGAATPFFLRVSWTRGAKRPSAGWPVNVTDPALLPPPEELRELSSAAILEALASVRPLPQAIQRAVERSRQGHVGSSEIDLDPLKRHSARLLGEAKSVARALVGLRRRLERPVASEEALRWRLRESPVSPLALGKRLAADADVSRTSSETAFALAELALTLARVDWDLTSKYVSREIVDSEVRKVSREIRALCPKPGLDSGMERYVSRAFREVAKR